MRIDSVSPKELLNQYTHIKEKVSVESTVSSADKVDLPNEARAFSTALKAAREAVETRTPEELSRIDKISKQIAEGTYSVSGEEVAKKILGK